MKRMKPVLNNVMSGLSLFVPTMARVAGVCITLFAAGSALKLQFPTLDYNQISLTVAIVAFAYDYSQQRKDSQDKAIAAKWQELHDQIRNLAVEVDKLGDDYHLHKDSYSHAGIERDFRALQERSLTSSAQITSLWNTLRLKEEIAELSKKIK